MASSVGQGFRLQTPSSWGGNRVVVGCESSRQAFGITHLHQGERAGLKTLRQGSWDTAEPRRQGQAAQVHAVARVVLMLSPWDAGTAEQQLRGTRLLHFEHLLRTGHHGGRHRSPPVALQAKRDDCGAVAEKDVCSGTADGRRQVSWLQLSRTAAATRVAADGCEVCQAAEPGLNVRSVVDLCGRRRKNLALSDFTMLNRHKLRYNRYQYNGAAVEAAQQDYCQLVTALPRRQTCRYSQGIMSSHHPLQSRVST